MLKNRVSLEIILSLCTKCGWVSEKIEEWSGLINLSSIQMCNFYNRQIRIYDCYFKMRGSRAACRRSHRLYAGPEDNLDHRRQRGRSQTTARHAGRFERNGRRDPHPLDLQERTHRLCADGRLGERLLCRFALVHVRAHGRRGVGRPGTQAYRNPRFDPVPAVAPRRGLHDLRQLR